MVGVGWMFAAGMGDGSAEGLPDLPQALTTSVNARKANTAPHRKRFPDKCIAAILP